MLSVISNAIVILIIVGVVYFAIRQLINDKAEGKGGCSGNCSGCGGSCHKFKLDKNEILGK